jgi:acetyltransferase
VSLEHVRRILADRPAAEALDQTQAGRLLTEYGIACLPAALAHTPDEAVALGGQMGFPVALKVASPDLLHKSDVGGVLLDVSNGPAVAQGFAQLVQEAQRARPDAEILGVHVQRMAPPGQEVIVGAVRDPQFGPLIMFGAGGIEVEEERDVAFALAPLSREEAEDLVLRTWAGRRLRGYRSVPPADLAAAVDVVLRLAQLAADFPQLAEIEINPLRVLAKGQGAVALDVRARIDPRSEPAAAAASTAA